jgi:hypothetical protein
VVTLGSFRGIDAATLSSRRMSPLGLGSRLGITPACEPIGAGAGTASARLCLSFLKWLTARSVNSARLPPLTTVSPWGVTSRFSVALSWRR